MKKLLILGIATALMAVACAAYAYPTFSGPTGLVFVPDTKVVATGSLDAALDFWSTKPDNTFPLRATYGAYENVEVGAMFAADSNNNSWDLNAKYKLPWTWQSIDFAATGLIGKNAGKAWDGDLFLMAERALLPADGWVPGVRGLLGLDLPKVGGGDVKLRGDFALEAAFPYGITGALEYATKTTYDAKALLSGVVRYAMPWVPGLNVQAGVTDGHGPDYKFFIGADYAFPVMGK